MDWLEILTRGLPDATRLVAAGALFLGVLAAVVISREW